MFYFLITTTEEEVLDPTNKNTGFLLSVIQYFP